MYRLTGIEAIEKGKPVTEYLPFLHGLLPAEPEPLSAFRDRDRTRPLLRSARLLIRQA